MNAFVKELEIIPNCSLHTYNDSVVVGSVDLDENFKLSFTLTKYTDEQRVTVSVSGKGKYSSIEYRLIADQVVSSPSHVKSLIMESKVFRSLI